MGGDGVPGAFSDGVDYHRVVLPTDDELGVRSLECFLSKSDGRARAHRTKYNTVSYNVPKC
jgi:hypothetical protein